MPARAKRRGRGRSATLSASFSGGGHRARWRKNRGSRGHFSTQGEHHGNPSIYRHRGDLPRTFSTPPCARYSEWERSPHRADISTAADSTDRAHGIGRLRVARACGDFAFFVLGFLFGVCGSTLLRFECPLQGQAFSPSCLRVRLLFGVARASAVLRRLSLFCPSSRAQPVAPLGLARSCSRKPAPNWRERLALALSVFYRSFLLAPPCVLSPNKPPPSSTQYKKPIKCAFSA